VLLYQAEVKEFQREFVQSILFPDGTYEHGFYYSLDLPEPFAQEEGTIYWVAISAIMQDDNPPFPWGWETSDRHWNDNATRFWFFNNYWQEITPDLLPPWYSERYNTVDMAFELTVSDETDADGDGVWDACDNCRAATNAAQIDSDGDGIGDACDYCRNVDVELETGSQHRDDDLDGIGNVCDIDFDQSGFGNVTDLIRFLDAFGKNTSDSTCPDPTGAPTGSCAVYDVTAEGPVINVNDLLVVIGPLFGQSISDHGCAPADDGSVHCPLP
jgi:hypothetical protein